MDRSTRMLIRPLWEATQAPMPPHPHNHSINFPSLRINHTVHNRRRLTVHRLLVINSAIHRARHRRLTAMAILRKLQQVLLPIHLTRVNHTYLTPPLFTPNLLPRTSRRHFRVRGQMRHGCPPHQPMAVEVLIRGNICRLNILSTVCLRRWALRLVQLRPPTARTEPTR